MFWRLGLHFQESAVSKLLDGEECTLEKLLDEDEIITECRSHNEKLIKFLSTVEVVQQLVDYLTTMPADPSEKREKKYPHHACEIMCCDVSEIYEVLFDEKHALLSRFMGFLLQPAPLHSALAGYFHRVVLSIMGKKPNQVISLMQSDPKWVNALITHIGSFGISELLLRLMGAEPSAEEGADMFGAMGLQMRGGGGFRTRGNLDSVSEDSESLSAEDNVKWWLGQGTLSKLLDKLNEDESSEVHANVAAFTCDLAKRFSQGPSSKIVLDALLSEDVIKKLICCVVDSKSSSVLTHGLAILSELLHTVQEHDESDVSDVHVVYRVLSDNLESLLFLLEPGERLVELSTTVQVLSPPLGQARLRVVQFFESLFSANKTFVDNRLAEIHVLPKIMDLFFQYEWHNILHCIVDRIFKIVIGGSNEALKNELFKECKIVSQILRAVRQNDRECSRHRGHRKGYMGHVLSMAATLENQSSMDPTVSSYLEAEPRWKDFAKGKLAEVLTIESRPLAGSTNWQMALLSPSAAAHDEDEDDEDDFDTWDVVVEDTFEKEATAAIQDGSAPNVSEEEFHDAQGQEDSTASCASNSSPPVAPLARPITGEMAGTLSPPPTAAAGAPGCTPADQQFNSFNYWRTPIPDFDFAQGFLSLGK